MKIEILSFQDIMILAQGGTQPMLFVKQPSNGTHSTNGTTVSAMKGVKFVEKSPKSISWTNVNDIVLFNSYLQPREREFGKSWGLYKYYKNFETLFNDIQYKTCL